MAYESEITKFLRELKKNNPNIEVEQRKGRAIWWDKPQDSDTSARQVASRVPQNSYVYGTKD